MRLVMIEWLDAFGCSPNWQDFADIREPKPMICRSVGWLASDGAECKVIVPHVADTQDDVPMQGCGDMTIPTNCIRRICDLSQQEWQDCHGSSNTENG